MSTESERVARLTAEGENFVPEGTGPKKYVVTCKNSSDWNEIHDYIINENEIDGIPNRKIECTDDCKSCDRMATYEMSDEEAEQLKLHPKVAGVNIDPDFYQGTFKGYADQVISTTNRYGTNVKIGRDFDTNFFPTNPDSTLLRRTGASVYRHQQQTDFWDGSADTTIINADPQYRGDGTDVDVIVCDESGWYGHVEFIKTGVGEPSNFVGENVLKSGFASSATTGKCGVLDCVLDLPYYLDPDFFEANAGSRLTTRWDGTKVPVESVARDWWGNNSTSYRSAKYVSSGNGGSATGDNDFGTVTISSSYTRANSNGTNTTQHAGGGYHATPCMAQAYGKTHGWAFNANKWHMSIIWSTGAVSITSCFKIIKIFHQCKPNRSSDNTKNPTITSHSWGRNRNITNGYYYFRTAGDGTGGVSYTSGTKPGFLNNLYYGTRYTSHSDPSYSESVLGKAIVDAGVIFVSAAGNDNQKMVLQGHADYNNYDDSGSSTTLASALTGDVIGRTSMTNRPGFPSDVGFSTASGSDVYQSFNIGALDSNKSSNTQERKANYSNMGNGIDCYAIGADSLAGCDDNSSGRKNRYDAYYNIESASTYSISASNSGSSAYTLSGSDRNGSVSGNNVTVTLNVGDTVNFSVSASGHPFWIKTTNSTGTSNGASGVTNNGAQSGTVSWTPDTSGTYYYICQFHSSMVGTITVQYTSRESEDREFGGTSSACPVVTGLMATKLQHNRTWTWSNLKTWLANDVTDQSASAMYTGTESTTANDSGWAEDYNLQGGLRKIIWDAPVSSQTPVNETFALKFSGGNLTFSGAFSSKPVPPFTGELYQKSYAALILYVNTSSQTKTSFIVTNDTFETTTVHDGKGTYSTSIMGGFTGTRTHMHARGYVGSHRMIKMSDLSYTEGSGTSPSEYARSPYTYNNSYPNNLIGANWSNNAYYTTSSTTTPAPTFSVGILTTTSGITTSGSGYIHGTASMNGYSIWGSAIQSGGMDKSRIFKTTDGGVNWTEVYSNSPYSFNGYLGAYPDYNGGKFMWWLSVSGTNSVLSSSDGESWTNEGSQSNGPGAPNYHGLQEIVYNKHTSKFYFCWRNTVCKESSDGVTWTTAQTFSTKHYNVVVMFDGGMVGMTIDGSNVKFYKYPLSGTSIDWANPTLLNTSAIASDFSAIAQSSYPVAGVYGFTAHSSGG